MGMLSDVWPTRAGWRRWGSDSVARLLGRRRGGRSRRRPRGSAAAQRSLVERELERLGRPELAAALAALPAHAVVARTPVSLAAHLVLAAEPLADGQVRTRVRDGEHPGVAELLVVARDRPGLLATMAAVLALRGVSILAADAATRADGLAFDAFEVVAPPDGWAGVAADLAEALSGRRAIEEWLSQVEPPPVAGAAAPRVTIDNGRSPDYSVVDVRGPDRLGLLYHIARGLFDLGLDIQSAEIETRASGVVDTFQVRALDGGARLDDARAADVARALEERLAAGAATRTDAR
ncbi:MAG TPA: ACT domain-containing protein [Chloroflexota bacterium]